MSYVNGSGEETEHASLITAVEFARIIKVSTRTLWRLRSAVRVPEPMRLGGLVRWQYAEIKKWIAEGCPIPAARENEHRRNP